jgi:eukaryotic-like serine/threonine-protein kinase
MGVVWRAEDQVIGREVALKELPAPQGLSANQTAVYLERVLREARTAGRLNDPAVVTVFDVVSENGVTYIVMELVEAPTLADMIPDGGLPADRVAAIGLQVLGALETAHAAGVVHRDVKPSNIMVLPGDRVKLADFGIARAMDDPSLTMTGGIMGSPGYMAPELFSGSGPAAPSDLWALGATLFHAVEGRAPFTRETTAATMHAIMYDDPRLTKVQGPLAQVIMGLLAQPVETRLTGAQARELLTTGTRPVAGITQVVPDTTQVVEAPTQRVHAVPRNTMPREPWQESFPAEVPLAAPAAVNWGEDEWSPSKKPAARRKIALLAGGGVLAVAALVAVFLIVPKTPQGEAAPGPTTPTVADVAETGTPSDTPSSTTPPSSAAPPSSAVSGPPPAATVTVTKPGQAPGGGGPKPNPPLPPPVQPPGGEQPPPKPRTLLALSRFNHPKGWHFSGTSQVAAPGGFTREGGLGSLVKEPEDNTMKLYACQLKGSDDRMTSVDPACEGHTMLGTLGYIFKTKPAGTAVYGLYRCHYNGGHFDSVINDCEGPDNRKEFQFGWVVAK